MDGADVGKATTRRDDREGRSGLPRKKNRPVFDLAGCSFFAAAV